MELLLLVAIAFGLIAVDHRAAQTQPAGPSDGSGSPPGTAPPQPPPGIYPAGTPVTFPIVVSILNSDRYGKLTVSPGGVVFEGEAKTFWYGPGTPVSFKAEVQGGFPPPLFTAFDHFDGPGISTRQNPFTVQIWGAGYVRAVYAFAGSAPA
jgi:hypothetical protein